MSRPGFWTTGFTKEIRALLPVWLGSLAGVSASFASPAGAALAVSCAGYGICAIALGSQLFGQEFGWRTLGLLLAQPVDRRRLLAVKLGALALLLSLSSLLIVGAMTFRAAEFADFWLGRSSLLAVGLLGLGAAPAFTLATRNALAGLVFTCALPGLFLVLGDAAVNAAGITDGSAADAARRAVFGWGSSIAAAGGLVATAYLFVRAQWLDGNAAFDLSSAAAPAASRRVSRQAAWTQLVKKELRLQQLAVAVAGITAAIWFALAIVGLSAFGVEVLVAVVVVTFGGVVSLLIGATAGTGETQIGVRESQLLMPMPVRHQWAIKVAGAGALLIVLCVALPAAMSLGTRWATSFGGRPPAAAPWLGGVVLIGAVGLYVGTLSRSTTWAFVAAVPVLAPGIYILSTLAWFAAWWVSRRLGQPRVVSAIVEDGRWMAAALTAFVALLIVLGYVNYRRPDRSPRQIAAQAVALTAVALVLLTALNLLRWS